MTRFLLLLLVVGVLGAPADAATTSTGREGVDLANTVAPRVLGVPEYRAVLRSTGGHWTTRPTRVRYQWLRDGVPIDGATTRRHRVAPDDVGHRLRVLVTASAPGHGTARARSASTPRVRYDVPVRRRVGYSVTTRGHVGADVARFARLAQQTYDDPRGWRGRGVAFHRVRRGGGFTLVLAQARTMTSFSSGCSAQYSCRVGRLVIINLTRWRHASPAWRRAGGTLRDYRHLVVNHETGHWLGFGHVGCPGPGRLAPVMMQQSKGLHGCRINAWPTTHELRR